jgi:hypothetical protein
MVETHGAHGAPSEAYERIRGIKIKDIALLQLQKVVDNPEVGIWLINAHWRIYQLRIGNGSFILSDRPLIRLLERASG